MKNIYFPDENISHNDLYFMCYMIERVSRKIHQHNKYTVNAIGKTNLEHLISLANVLHSKNPLEVEKEWIDDYNLVMGEFDIRNVDKSLVSVIPSETQIAKVYKRLIISTLQPNEDYVDGLLRIYNNDICQTIDNYNCSAFYEPSYVITRAYNSNGF